MAEKPILLVEDETIVRDLLGHVLRAEGYSVDAVATAAEAMAHLDERRYALVISDWRLPDGDGTRIADMASALGAETFVMSGYLFQMPGDTAQLYATLMKPLRPNELIAAVERRIGPAR